MTERSAEGDQRGMHVRWMEPVQSAIATVSGVSRNHACGEPNKNGATIGRGTVRLFLILSAMNKRSTFGKQYAVGLGLSDLTRHAQLWLFIDPSSSTYQATSQICLGIPFGLALSFIMVYIVLKGAETPARSSFTGGNTMGFFSSRLLPHTQVFFFASSR
ncbi:hypothetical protein BC827DRAFT_1297192 [Russula dissimulans]|nr:hypothetical protein BC827DRAFT_1297192 [Russula dissimulans]